jgi:NRPS condensation-like uncharacterized protein
MKRQLGAFEQSFWLYDQILPVHFSLNARIKGQIHIEQLSQALAQVRHAHPLLRSKIEVDSNGIPHFIEATAPIPLRVVARQNDQQWEREVETELSQSFDYTVAPLARVVLLHSEDTCDLIFTCYHAIADGLSIAYVIRDILQALNSDLPSISDSLSLEQALQIESIETAPTKNCYSTAVSTRSRPIIRTALLSRELTQRLLDRARQEKTTVHGAISAAFLKAMNHESLKCLSPINLRSYLPESVQEAMGVYITYGSSQHSSDSELWEIARSLKSQLAEFTNPNRWQAEIGMRQTVLATSPEAEMVFHAMRQQHGYNLLVSNLGRLNIGQQYGSVQLETIYGPAVMAGLPEERIVGVATIGGQLSLTVCFDSTTIASGSDQIMADAMHSLNQAVESLCLV